MPDEPGAPPQIKPTKLGDYLDVMSKAVFQTGISWKVVNNKWSGIQAAMRGFDATTVATLTPDDLDALVQDTRMIRNRRKIEAIVHNADRMVELEQQHGSFKKYLRSHGDFDALVRDLRKQFKFLGDMGCYYFLYVVGERVPPYEEWHATHSGRR
jgi:3-methyladenine DNA glycosylase Tag